MKAFVTGGTGFIGRALVHKLLERGDDVTVLVRSAEKAADLKAAGAVIAQGDITDRESMRLPMAGSDVVYHVAGWYKLGVPDWDQAEAINVEGTRNVLELAHELGVPRIIYTSTVAVFGNTSGKELRTLDENYRMPEDMPFASEYDRTKWKAHYEVALPLIEKGAPVTILMPGSVYGPGDTSLVGQLMEAYLRGWMSVVPGPETTITLAHVEDIAEAHLLAVEKGRPGQTYIVTGEPFNLGELFQLWSKVSGKRPPLASIPARYLRALEPVAEALERVLPMPTLLSADGARMMNMHYVGWPGKAHRELGWGTRAIEDGMHETYGWLGKKLGSQPELVPPERRFAGFALLAAFAVFTAWYLRRQRK